MSQRTGQRKSSLTLMQNICFVLVAKAFLLLMARSEWTDAEADELHAGRAEHAACRYVVRPRHSKHSNSCPEC